MAGAARAQERFLLPVYPNRGLTFERGEGVYLIAAGGDRYLDLMSNYGVNVLGYGHAGLKQAVGEQLDRLANLHGSFWSPVRSAASRELLRRCGPPYRAMFWSNSGAEAVEAALKLAVLATGKHRFVAARGAFHGKTIGALAATWGRKYRSPFEPLPWEFVHVEYGNVDAAAEAMNGGCAGIIVEPIQGEAGIVTPPPGYLAALRRLCDRHHGLLILDEVQTGVGRTGKWLASEWDGVAGDILCLGKGLAGGLPVGATLVSGTVAHAVSPSVHSSTFGGSPLVCAAVRAVLAAIDDRMLAHIAALGDYFGHALEGAAAQFEGRIRGMGLMIGVDVGTERNAVLRALQRRRVLAIPAGDTVVRFLPPYIIERRHIDEAVRALADSLGTRT